MRKFFISFALIAAVAVSFVSCTKEIDHPEESSAPMKTIKVITDIATKTTLEANHENIVWSTDDKISIFNDVDNTKAEVTYAAGEYITVTVPSGTEEIYALYPHYGGNNSGPKSVSVFIANNQTQENPGELNGRHFPMVAKGTVSADNKALISFYPVAGALALNIYKSTLDGTETVESVKVTPASTNTGFYGSQTTNITGNDVEYTSAAGTDDAVTVTLTNGLSLASSAPSNKQTFDGQIYVCLAKQSYAGVKFEIKTDKGTYTITSNSTAFDLVNNDFVPVNINLAKATFVEKPIAVDPTTFSWGLVKDALTVGDKVVIAAAGSDVAMSTTQNNNNRGQIDITKSGTALTAVDDVQVFEVVVGSKSNTVALKCLNGDKIGQYIAAASESNNNMHSVDAIDDNASWSISINGTTGVASVTAQGSYTRNILKYNSGNGVFSCYGSTNTMADVVFYRAGLPSADISFPEESYTVNIGETFTAPELANPNNVTVTYTSSNSDVAAVNASTGAITIGSIAGTATITASFAGNDTYGASFASYIISVIDLSVNDFTWDLTEKSYSSATTDQVKWENDNVMMIADKANATTNANNYLPPTSSSTRFYKNSKLTFRPATGVTITKIEYTATTTGYATAFASSTWSNATASVSELIVTVIPENGTTDIIATIGGTTGASSVKVYYKGSPSVVETEYTITIITPTNGTLTSSATSATQGTEITLTATPAEGYQLGELIVTEATSGAAVTVTNGIFTMPASNVTVSASFIPVQTGEATYSMTIDSATGSNGTCDVTWKNAGTTSVTHNGITWSTTVEGDPAFQGSNTECKIGTKNAPATKVTISTTGFAGKKIKSASLTGYCTTNTGPTLTIMAGDNTMLSATSLVKTNSTTYSSTNNNITLGESSVLSFEINSSAAAGIVISKIEITYE